MRTSPEGFGKWGLTGAGVFAIYGSNAMKFPSLILALAVLASLFASCAPARRSGMGYRPYGAGSPIPYENAPGGWDVYRVRGGHTRLKYTE